MNERARQDAERDLRAGGKDKVEITYQAPPQRYTVPILRSRSSSVKRKATPGQ
jgi:hypothetical protein